MTYSKNKGKDWDDIFTREQISKMFNIGYFIVIAFGVLALADVMLGGILRLYQIWETKIPMSTFIFICFILLFFVMGFQIQGERLNKLKTEEAEKVKSE